MTNLTIQIKNFIWRTIPSRYLIIAWGTKDKLTRPWWLIRLSKDFFDNEEMPQEYLTLFVKEDLNLYFDSVIRFEDLEREFFNESSNLH